MSPARCVVLTTRRRFGDIAFARIGAGRRTERRPKTQATRVATRALGRADMYAAREESA